MLQLPSDCVLQSWLQKDAAHQSEIAALISAKDDAEHKLRSAQAMLQKDNQAAGVSCKYPMLVILLARAHKH